MPAPVDQDRCLALLDAHQGILRKVANAYCPRAEDRDDLVQEISIQVWRSYPRFDGRCKFSTWLYRVALNVAISFHRTESPHHHALSGDEQLQAIPAPADAAPPSDEILALRRFIGALGDLDKALVLLYLDEHSHADIAEILGLSASNVGTRISRIKLRLRQDLASGPTH